MELCNDPNDIYDDSSRISSFFDLFTNGGGGFVEKETTTTTTNTVESKESKERRERTVIDVDSTKDD